MSHNSMPTPPAEHRCDVLVIGGGPAGSTAATLLEKAHHPRFHIGESLLPANLPLFEKLGVRAEAKHGPKQFYCVTNSTMRDLFMSPSNIFRVQEALLSVLAGDIYGKRPSDIRCAA